MIQIDMEMPEKCGLCPLFHAEHPMHCQGVKADCKKKIVAPYGQPRPDWCPLHEVIADPDTVSRQAVLDAVDAITKWSLLDRNGCHVGVGMKYRDVKETVKSLPSSPSRPQWIPCSERLPEHDKIVLCCTYGGVLFIGHIRQINKGEYLAISDGSNGRTEYCIVAWMPLPEPYQGN